jgi:hypothetical protein
LFGKAFDVHDDRGQNVLDVSLGQAVVTAAARPVTEGQLGDGALDSGAHGVDLTPGGVLLVGAVTRLEFMQLLGKEVDRAGSTAAGA